MTMLFCIAESKIKAIHTYIQLPSTNPRRLPVISSACIIICASLKPCVGHVVRWKIGISNVIVEGEREGERKRGRPIYGYTQQAMGRCHHRTNRSAVVNGAVATCTTGQETRRMSRFAT